MRLQQAFLPGPGAQLLHQRRVFGPALREQVAHPVEHGLHGGKIGLFVLPRLRRALRDDVGLRRLGRLQGGIGQQGVGQRLQSGLARQLALGAALELVGQVQVFQLLFCGTGRNGPQQRWRQLALFLDGLAHDGAACVEFAQVAQTQFQFTQLHVVQPRRGLLAVAGDKGHGGATVEQGDSSLYLLRAHTDFLRDLRDEVLHGDGKKREGRKSSARVCHSGTLGALGAL